MKFVVMTMSYFAAKGFDPSKLRQSADRTKAMCHLEYARILVPDIENNPNAQIYHTGTDEFNDLLASSEWTMGGPDELMEDDSLASRVSNLEASDTEKDDQIKILTQTIVNMQLENMTGGE